MKIKIVCGPELMREGELPECFWVGFGNPVVARIEEENENLGTYGITWFVAYDSDDKPIGKMNALHVATVKYAERSK